jgi:hypothetical protein
VLASKGPRDSGFAKRRTVGDAETAEYPAIAAVDSAVIVASTNGAADRSVISVARVVPASNATN